MTLFHPHGTGLLPAIFSLWRAGNGCAKKVILRTSKRSCRIFCHRLDPGPAGRAAAFFSPGAGATSPPGNCPDRDSPPFRSPWSWRLLPLPGIWLPPIQPRPGQLPIPGRSGHRRSGVLSQIQNERAGNEGIARGREAALRLRLVLSGGLGAPIPSPQAEKRPCLFLPGKKFCPPPRKCTKEPKGNSLRLLVCPESFSGPCSDTAYSLYGASKFKLTCPLASAYSTPKFSRMAISRRRR